MSNRDKAVKRRQKILARKRDRLDRQQSAAWHYGDKLKRANASLHESLEVVIKRMCDKLKVSDLAARFMLADLLRQQIMVDTGPPIAVPTTTSAAVDRTDYSDQASNDPVLGEKPGFDKKAWAPPA